MTTISKIPSIRPEDIDPEDIVVAFLVHRFNSLPKEALADLASLAPEFAEVHDPEARRELSQTIKEILFPELIGELHEGSAGSAVETENVVKRKEWIGRKIEEKRKAAGLTQAQLADLSGLPQSHISRLEAGRHSPSYKTMERIASALRTPIGELDPSN